MDGRGKFELNTSKIRMLTVHVGSEFNRWTEGLGVREGGKKRYKVYGFQ